MAKQDFLDLQGLSLVVNNINDLLDGKVAKEDGKELSTNDFTTEEKEKLASIPNGITYINGSSTETGELLPVNADTLEEHPANYFATAESVTNIVNGTTAIVASEGTDYTDNRVRNSVLTTEDPGVGTVTNYANGSIIYVYEE